MFPISLMFSFSSSFIKNLLSFSSHCFARIRIQEEGKKAIASCGNWIIYIFLWKQFFFLFAFVVSSLFRRRCSGHILHVFHLCHLCYCQSETTRYNNIYEASSTIL